MIRCAKTNHPLRLRNGLTQTPNLFVCDFAAPPRRGSILCAAKVKKTPNIYIYIYIHTCCLFVSAVALVAVTSCNLCRRDGSMLRRGCCDIDRRRFSRSLGRVSISKSTHFFSAHFFSVHFLPLDRIIIIIMYYSLLLVVVLLLLLLLCVCYHYHYYY